MDFENLQRVIPQSTTEWSSEDVCKWLDFINLPALSEAFKNAFVNGSNIHFLNDDNLRDSLGVHSVIIRKKLVNWISFGLRDYNDFLKDQKINDKICAPNLKKNITTCVRNNEHKVKPVEHLQSFSPSKEDALILEQFEGNSLGVYVIKNRIMSIGYGKDNHIHSLQTSISDHHALIGHKNHSYFIQDLGSKHGTFTKINHRQLLQLNTIIEIGSYQFRVHQLNSATKSINLFCLVCSEDDIQKSMEKLGEENKENSKNGNILTNKADSNMIRKKPSPRQEMESMALVQNHLVINLEEARGNKFTFGRRKQCNFQKNDKHMSGMHCKIIFCNGSFWLEDYGSTNGTWIRLSPPNTPSVETPIQDGSIIKIGTTITYICRVNSSLKDQHQTRMLDESEEEENNKMMKEEGFCRKCKVQVNNCLFFPCSHNPVCQKCSTDMQECVQCNQKIHEKIRIYK